METRDSSPVASSSWVASLRVLSRIECSRSFLAFLAAAFVSGVFEESTRAWAPAIAAESASSRAPSATAITEKLRPCFRRLSTASTMESTL